MHRTSDPSTGSGFLVPSEAPPFVIKGRDEAEGRESARSEAPPFPKKGRDEVRHAGADERLFVDLSRLAIYYYIPKFTPNSLAREITTGQIIVFIAFIQSNANIIIKPYGSILAYSTLKL